MPKPKARDSSTRVLKPQAPQLGLNHFVNADQLMILVENLKEEISALKLGFSKSENLRKVIELRLAQLQERDKSDSLLNLMALDNTTLLKDFEDKDRGFFWNLWITILDQLLIKKALHAHPNMIRHQQLSKNEVEITAGFSGPDGNLIWFNTGECDLLLRLSTEQMS